MAIEPPKPTPMREVDLGHYIRHYLNLLWRWKLWILISGPLVAISTLIYMVKFAPSDPALTAQVLIGLENTASMSAFTDIVNVDNSKASTGA